MGDNPNNPNKADPMSQLVAVQIDLFACSHDEIKTPGLPGSRKHADNPNNPNKVAQTRTPAQSAGICQPGWHGEIEIEK